MDKKGIFRFKQFEVRHLRSSMKVGIDSILLGCWADMSDVKRILDVGTGCGILALICAQRSIDAEIKGIDIHSDSITEASLNFGNSQWSDRLTAEINDFSIFKETGFDLIISNPPYFNSGLEIKRCAREKARHQDSLSPLSLIEKGYDLLNKEGRLVFIFPFERGMEIKNKALDCGFKIKRWTIVRGRPELPPKRILVELYKTDRNDEIGISSQSCCLNECTYDEITIDSTLNNPSEQFKSLCKDFYLDF